MKSIDNSLVLSFLLACCLGVLTTPSIALAENDKDLTREPEKVFDLDLQELMDMDVVVTTVGKKPQQLHKVASAVYVLTQEDIRRSGAVNIMEALRMVPGVLVSKINQNRYAISIRGFNRRQGSDKLLVMIDGRSVYSPVASGVFWIGQDTVMEDIDRIEVIRGPGASLWGSNAVAGVINIITKNAKDTESTLLSGGLGTEENGFFTLRHGTKVTEGLSLRVYGKGRKRDEGQLVNGNDALDSKEMGQGGFRGDWEISEKDNLTFQGDYYSLTADLDFISRFVSLTAGSQPFRGTTSQKGTNFLARWNHNIDAESSTQLQIYFDRLDRKSEVPFNNVIDQLDVDFQHDFFLGELQNITWGLNYRYIFYNFEPTNITRVFDKKTDLFGFFLQDEIFLIPNEWSLIVGSKFEHNEFSGLEVQPSVRTAWTPNSRHTFWGAVSRAVRIPNITEEASQINRVLVPGAPPLLIRDTNLGRTNAENLLAYELGYRYKSPKSFQLDATTFLFEYTDIIEGNVGTVFFEPVPPPPHLVLPVFNDNSLDGEVYGFELSGKWTPVNNWRLSGSYTYSKVDLRPTKPTVLNPAAFNSEGDFDAEREPHHMFNIRSYLNLPYDLELDAFYYYVSKNFARKVPAYGRLDLRIGWRPNDHWDISLVSQNVTDEAHQELNELLEVASETQRSFYFKITLNY